MNNDIDLLNELMNYHRDRVDELVSPEDRLEKIPFHLRVVEMLARYSDYLIEKELEVRV
jgi:hypothetical protein